MKTANNRSRKAEIETETIDKKIELLKAMDLMKMSGTRLRIAKVEMEMIDKQLELMIDLDQVLTRALDGDGRAVASLAAGFGGVLLEHAEEVLGPDYAHEGADVLQELFLSLLEGQVTMRPSHGRAIPWICGIVRAIGRKHRSDRNWDWDIEDYDEEWPT